MFNIVLHQPEIPPNTGNVIRLCANTGARLHLIKPLGFHLNHNALRRAGLDYHECADVRVHADWEAYLAQAGETRVFACSSKAAQAYHETTFSSGDTLLFGSETTGLPDSVMAQVPSERQIVIPMRNSGRCLNLSNAVAVVLYEALRQHRFRFA